MKSNNSMAAWISNKRNGESWSQMDELGSISGYF